MITLAHFVGLSFVLFTIGVVGVLVRRNLLTVLMSIELMLNAVNINLVAFSRQLGDLTGQVFSIFVIAVAAGEAAIGLAHHHLALPAEVVGEPRRRRRR